jgi:hypothetical protein
LEASAPTDILMLGLPRFDHTAAAHVVAAA